MIISWLLYIGIYFLVVCRITCYHLVERWHIYVEKEQFISAKMRKWTTDPNQQEICFEIIYVIITPIPTNFKTFLIFCFPLMDAGHHGGYILIYFLAILKLIFMISLVFFPLRFTCILKDISSNNLNWLFFFVKWKTW